MSRKRHRRGGRRGTREPWEEICGYLRQRHISDRNIERLKQHGCSDDLKLRTLAELVLDIARVKPHSRRRVQVLASKHWPLFVRCVHVLGDRFFDVFPSTFDPQSYWVWDRWERACEEIWRQTHGALPCRCGSAVPYAECCAERDEEYASQLAAEESDRWVSAAAGSTPAAALIGGRSGYLGVHLPKW